MNLTRKRKKINAMSPAAYNEKLGDCIPLVVSAVLKSSDIKSGVATVKADCWISNVCSVIVKKSDGTIRTVSKIVFDANTTSTISITAADVAAGDIVTMLVL